ncbi:MAG TPA: substrate-binding and VWA domain-containing protein [Candidatus Polarisedimenticolia bacterium]|nr:substrate-binding and VWA domain-containing protein [Candidatus Polarisedimenticolia bacterium]
MKIPGVTNGRALVITLAFAIVMESVVAFGYSWCVSVVVASSQEKSALLADLAREYNASSPRVGLRCVRVTVNQVKSGDAEEALARNWDRASDGPKPAVWSPAAKSWLILLQQQRSAAHLSALISTTPTSLANSPLVVAMPKPMAETMGWPDQTFGWSDLVALAREDGAWSHRGHPEWEPFRLGKTNPLSSTSGLHALIGTYYAAVDGPPVEADLSSTKVSSFVRDVESSVVHYGDSVATFLVNLLEADRRGVGLSYVSAIAMEEKQVIDYNNGNPRSLIDPPNSLPPRNQLLAFYPEEGTFIADHPYAILDAASWVDSSQRTAAEAFLSYLLSPAVQQRFARAGFRSHDLTAGPLINRDNGVLDSQPRRVLTPPSGPLIEGMQRSWNDLRKRADVLLVIDTSLPMSGLLPGRAAKLDLAKDAAAAALESLSPEDRVGIWIYPSRVTGGKPYEEVAPLAPLASRRESLRALIQGLSASNADPPLYATTRAAVTSVAGAFDPKRINAVVLLASGQNNGADANLQSLLRELQTEAVPVRVFGVTYGTHEEASDIQNIAEASHGAAYEALDAATIGLVISALLSNF